MRKITMLGAVAFMAGTMAWAQEPSTYGVSGTGHGSADADSAMKGENGGMTKGCLAGTDGNYTLTQDKTGRVYMLQGDTGKLKDHVGHEIAVSGTTKTDMSNSASKNSMSSGDSAMASNSATGSTTIDVKKVKMISANCSK